MKLHQLDLKNNNIIVKPEIKDKVGSLYIPASYSSVKAAQAGRVLKKSDGITSIQINETVLFLRFKGQLIKINNHDYLILKEEDLLGVIR